MPALLERPLTSDPEWTDVLATLTRRELLTGAAAASILSLGLAACGSHTSAADPTGGNGGWAYTDDRGKRVHLSARPKRVACLTDTAAAALWASGLRPVAATDSHEGIENAVGFDFTGVRNIGTGTPNIDLEALAAARPDLLVDTVQPDRTLQVTSSTPKVTQIAPVLGIDMYRPVQDIVASADRLTAAIGTSLADLTAKARYDASTQALKTAVAANSRLRVAFLFDISISEIGLMNKATWPVLQTAADAGMKLAPVKAGSANLYSEAYSWELVPTIPADFIVWAVSDPLPTDPLWKQVPAVKAGQVWKPQIASWYAYSYANFTGLMADLAAHVRTAKADVGPT